MLLLCIIWSAQRSQFQIIATIPIINQGKAGVFEWKTAIIQFPSIKIQIQSRTFRYWKHVLTKEVIKNEINIGIISVTYI